MRRALVVTAALILVLVIALPIPGDQLVYQKPPKEVLDILEAPAPPNLSVNPTRTYALMSDAERYPSIADVSAPMLRLAGMRINPRTNGLHLAAHSRGLTIVRLADGVKIPVTLPPNAKASGFGSGRGGGGGRGGGREGAAWSPDGKQFVFENTIANGIELWLCDAASGKTRKLEGIKVNAVLGDPVVTTDTVVGAICAYFLLAVTFGNAYALVEVLSPGSFLLTPALAADVHWSPPTSPITPVLQYFSFSTLTTLGFGDVTPLSRGARFLAVIEAIAGQLYLAILIARLVGIHTSRSSS